MLSSAADKEYLANEQYNGMANYGKRINLKMLKWQAEEYQGAYHLNNFSSVLEIGSGNGKFWEYVAEKGPIQSEITISDLAQGMLDECKDNLKDLPFKPTYQLADIDKLPFQKNSFAAVLAHKVIYHSNNPKQAIMGIIDVLKPEGLFGMSLLNAGTNKVVWEIAHDICSEIPNESLSSCFTDTHADELLPTLFADVVKKSFVDEQKYESSDSIVEAVQSNPIVQPLKLSNDFFSLFRKKIDAIIDEEGCFKNRYAASLYLARGPYKS